MGKQVIVAAFLIITVASISLFLMREDRELRHSIKPGTKNSLLNLEEFLLYDYRDHELKGTVSGKIANFLDPNILEVYGKIKGHKYEKNQKEQFSGESAIVYFGANGITQIMRGAPVKSAEIENDVKISIGSNVLSTEFAEYNAKDNALRSELPVLIYGPTGTFKGNRGFNYLLEKEELTIFGPIRGLMQEGAVPEVDSL